MGTLDHNSLARPVQRHPGRRTRILIVGMLGLAAAGGAGYVLAVNHHGTQSVIAAQAPIDRAGQVMGFDLNATTHTFTKTSDGGIEQVVVHDPADVRNTDLIRAHLHQVAGQFGAGNFSDPASIHGAGMPGLAELQAGASRVQVVYEQVATGARINYRSADPVLIAALHSWFDAQTADHSMPGMGG